MNDADFLARFEAAAFTATEYGHREHLRTTWIYLGRLERETVPAAIAAGIRRLGTALGSPQLYHETLTRTWVALAAHAYTQGPRDDFGAFLAAHPHLLDRQLPYRHYSRELLGSDAARAGWVKPDLLPLPGSQAG